MGEGRKPRLGATDRECALSLFLTEWLKEFDYEEIHTEWGVFTLTGLSAGYNLIQSFTLRF